MTKESRANVDGQTVAAAIIAAPMAHADDVDLKYVNDLYVNSVNYGTASRAVSFAHQTCDRLRSGGTVLQAIGFLTQNFGSTNTDSQIGTTVGTYCPDQAPKLDAYAQTFKP